jgi:hypothetical protein
MVKLCIRFDLRIDLDCEDEGQYLYVVEGEELGKELGNVLRFKDIYYFEMKVRRSD